MEKKCYGCRSNLNRGLIIKDYVAAAVKKKKNTMREDIKLERKR